MRDFTDLSRNELEMFVRREIDWVTPLEFIEGLIEKHGPFPESRREFSCIDAMSGDQRAYLLAEIPHVHCETFQDLIEMFDIEPPEKPVDDNKIEQMADLLDEVEAVNIRMTPSNMPLFASGSDVTDAFLDAVSPDDRQNILCHIRRNDLDVESDLLSMVMWAVQDVDMKDYAHVFVDDDNRLKHEIYDHRIPVQIIAEGLDGQDTIQTDVDIGPTRIESISVGDEERYHALEKSTNFWTLTSGTSAVFFNLDQHVPDPHE